MADATQIVSAILGNSNALRQLGREIAMGMKDTTSYYSASAPSGGEAQMSGKAGGRGGLSQAQEIERTIKSQQLLNKSQKAIIEDYKGLTKTLKDNKKYTKEVTKNIDVFSRAFSDKWEDAMRRVSESAALEAKLRKQVTTALGREKEITLEGILELRERQMKLEKKIQGAQGKITPAVQRNIKEYRRISEALNDATNNLEDWGDSLKEKGQSFIKNFFSVEAALANLSIAVVQLTNDIKAQMKFGSQLGIWANQMTAIAAGVDPAALSEMMAGSRQVQTAFGDAAEFSDILMAQQRKYYRFIGDTTEAMQFAADSARLMGRSGVSFSQDSIDVLGQSFAHLNQITGITSSEFTGMMEGILMETDIRAQLAAVQESERAALIEGIAQQIRFNTAMGMTIEQATEAAKALGRISGETARDRFKRAAQMQMMMGAMGIGGGARAAELIRMGQRIGPAEKAELQTMMTAVANQAATSRVGAIGNEMMVDTMMDRTNMGQYLGKDSPFVTTMAAPMAAQPEQLDRMTREATRSANYLEELVRYADITQNFLVNGALGKMLVGIAQLIGAYVLGKAALGTAGRLGLGAAGAAGLGASAAVVGTALAGAGLGAAAGTMIYSAIDDTRAGIALSDSVGKLTDAIIMFTGVGDEEAAERRMMLRVAEETREFQEMQVRIAEREAEENKLQTTMLQTANALTEGLITQEEYNTRMQQMAMTGQPISLAE